MQPTPLHTGLLHGSVLAVHPVASPADAQLLLLMAARRASRPAAGEALQMPARLVPDVDTLPLVDQEPGSGPHMLTLLQEGGGEGAHRIHFKYRHRFHRPC